MGSWDFPPLPPHTVPVSGHTGGPAGRQQHSGEAGKEQTAPPISWERREAGAWAQSCQIRGVLCSDTGMGQIFTTRESNIYVKTSNNNSYFPLSDSSSSPSSTSEGLRMCLMKPSWRPWSLLRPKPRESVFCYRWTTAVRDLTVLEIGGVNQNIRKINGHYEKKDKTKGEGRYNAIETYSNIRVHWLCLQNKLWKRLRQQIFSMQ